jgi:CheY-like chemotaxis protein
MKPETVQAPVNPLRVMIVDDNDASAKTLGWAIEAAGHEVMIADSGQAAIENVKEFLPQVVLLDIGLPGMNGFEICQVMRQMPELAKTTFIAQTGWSTDEHKRMAAEAGFDHHLVKPVSLARIEELLNSFIAQRIAN